MGSRVLHAPKPQEGGNTDFGKAYYSYCQQRGLSINSTVLTSLLDSKKELWLDAEKLKKEEEWDPVLYALSVGAHEFKEIHVYCNWDSQKCTSFKLFILFIPLESSSNHKSKNKNAQMPNATNPTAQKNLSSIDLLQRVAFPKLSYHRHYYTPHIWPRS